MSGSSRIAPVTYAGYAAGGIAVVLAAAGLWVARRPARVVGPTTPVSAQTVAAPAPAPAAASVDPTWCGKPLGSRAVGLLKDRSACTKISLTGTAPACVFWADCGELHFEVDCSKPGPGFCRCDGDEGRTVAYSPALCTLDRTQPGAGLRAVLDSAASACGWAPK